MRPSGRESDRAAAAATGNAPSPRQSKGGLGARPGAGCALQAMPCPCPAISHGIEGNSLPGAGRCFTPARQGTGGKRQGEIPRDFSLFSLRAHRLRKRLPSASAGGGGIPFVSQAGCGIEGIPTGFSCTPGARTLPPQAGKEPPGSRKVGMQPSLFQQPARLPNGKSFLLPGRPGAFPHFPAGDSMQAAFGIPSIYSCPQIGFFSKEEISALPARGIARGEVWGGGARKQKSMEI